MSETSPLIDAEALLPPPPPARRRLLICSMLIGFTVTLFAGYIIGDGIPFGDQSEIHQTQRQLRSFQHRIDQYIQDRGVSPVDLPAVFPGSEREQFHWYADDAWGHPYQYRKINDMGYELFSLGRDGQTGGVGLDQDWRLPVFDQARLNFWSYTINPANWRLWLAALGTAIAMGAIVESSERKDRTKGYPPPTRPRLTFAVNLLVMTIAAIVCGGVMAVHHAFDIASISGH